MKDQFLDFGASSTTPESSKILCMFINVYIAFYEVLTDPGGCSRAA